MKKIVAILLLLCMVLTLTACDKADPKAAKYAEARELLEKHDYEAAYALFTQLGDYKDAKKEASYFRYIPISHRNEYVTEDGKEIVTYTVTLNDQNLPETVVEEYNSGYKHTCTIAYNEFGLVTHRKCSDTDDVNTSYEAKYDANGNCIHATIIDIEGNISEFDCTYDENDRPIKVVTTNAPDYYYLSYTSTYDAQGREIKTVYEYDDGITVEETTYDTSDKILKKTRATEDGVVDTIIDYRYDQKGRLVEILFTEKGENAGYREVTFNDKDQMLTEHAFYTFGYEYSNSYEYDEHGNAIKTTYSDSDSLGDDITESTYKLVYLPYEYTEEEWVEICDSTQCWDSTHW